MNSAVGCCFMTSRGLQSVELPNSGRALMLLSPLFSTISHSFKSSERRRLAICLAMLVGFAAALRLYGLDRWSLWLDETVQYAYAVTPFGELYKAMDAFAAPLSLELSHAFVQLGLDQTGAMLRMPSAILGVATVVIVYFLGNELFCRRVAWFSVLVACVMPVLVVYSQEYRPYSLLIFLTVVSAWLLAAALRTNEPAWWWVFAGSTILNLYTHFVALSALAGLAVFAVASILFEVQQGRPVKPLIASAIMAFGIIVIAYVPALPRLARLLESEAKAMGGPGPGWDVFRLVYIEHPGFGGTLSIIAAALAVLGIFWSALRFPRAFLFLITTLGISAALFHDHSHVTTSPRYVSFLMPLFAVAIGAGLAALSFAIEALAVRAGHDAKHAAATATALLTILVLFAAAGPLSTVYAANPKQIPADLREGFEYVRDRSEPNDLFLEASTSKGGSVYWFGSYDSYFLRKDFWPEHPTRAIVDDLNFPFGFKNYLKKQGRLWVLMTVGQDEQSSVEKRGGADFAVQCFHRICAIESLNPYRPMRQQLTAFFDRYTDLDPKYFEKSARAVRAEVEAGAR